MGSVFVEGCVVVGTAPNVDTEIGWDAPMDDVSECMDEGAKT